MKAKIFFITLCIIVCLFQQSKTFTNSSAIPWSTFSMGFAASSSTSDSVTAVVGQAFVGSIQQENTRIESGFLVAVALITEVDENGNQQMPLTYKLYQNYPNPFNPSTTIQFDLPKTSTVTLKLIDVLGREILTLVDKKLPPGAHKVIFDSQKLPSGVYFYQLQADEFTATRKLMLLK